jgi:hypothetical protein
LQIRDLLFLTAIIAILVAWSTDHNELSRTLELERQKKVVPRWQDSQVLGPPNTPRYGDIQTAWASATPDGMKEWLDLEFETFVTPKTIQIFETYNPGAVYKVSVFDWSGREVPVWQGTDPLSNTTKAGVAKIPVTKWFRSNRVKIYIDSPKVKGWNEIDAVAMVDMMGKKHWASRVTSSSSYGTNASGLMIPTTLRTFSIPTTTQLNPTPPNSSPPNARSTRY